MPKQPRCDASRKSESAQGQQTCPRNDANLSRWTERTFVGMLAALWPGAFAVDMPRRKFAEFAGLIRAVHKQDSWKTSNQIMKFALHTIPGQGARGGIGPHFHNR